MSCGLHVSPRKKDQASAQEFIRLFVVGGCPAVSGLDGQIAPQGCKGTAEPVPTGSDAVPKRSVPAQGF